MRLRWFFAFFFVSGFCSLVYEVVWLRLAMAAFGVTTPLVSIVLSVFMAGLALGSWLGGRMAARLSGGSARTALGAYAVVELLIGVSGLVVPLEMGLGRAWLRASVAGGTWGSSLYYAASAAVLTVVLLPFCAAMGATFPLALEAIRRGARAQADRAFSYLYLANVLGAAVGTLASALVFIELWGFRRTLLVAASLNGALAVSALWLARQASPAEEPAPDGEANGDMTPASPTGRDRSRSAISTARTEADARAPLAIARAVPWMLFSTGLASMGMEVVWIRLFNPYVGTVVYSFASILAIYLLATFAGSTLYRRRAWALAAGRKPLDGRPLWIGAALAALLPLLLADPRIQSSTNLLFVLARVAVGIGPVCLAIGFLTPMLLDRWTEGDPGRAGSLYAMNVLGCIVGPLVACFALMPFVGERGALLVLALPLLACGLTSAAAPMRGEPAVRAQRGRGWAFAAAAGLMALPLVLLTRDYETSYPDSEVRRDSTATVIATGSGMNKLLVVNGSGMTTLTPVTKMMAHLPLALHAGPPRNALVICFGMGTSFRSALAWGIPVTAIELVPSVPALFGYFHDDAAASLAAPGARVVVDDGRRYLERTSERYDMITVDPPPPIQAAGSSLLYTREFLDVVRSRLAPGGIVQVWLPESEDFVVSAVARALRESFPHVRVFVSHQHPGAHFIASAEPLVPASGAELAAKLPPRAAADLIEWSPGATTVSEFSRLLAKERPIDVAVNSAPEAPTMQDDRPVNEYFLLRLYAGIP